MLNGFVKVHDILVQLGERHLKPITFGGGVPTCTLLKANDFVALSFETLQKNVSSMLGRFGIRNMMAVLFTTCLGTYFNNKSVEKMGSSTKLPLRI